MGPKFMRHGLTLLLVVGLAALSLAACATPSQSFDARARLAGLTETTVRGNPFEHTVYWNRAALAMRGGSETGRVLHVYFDGDGQPWKAGHPTADPTARNPLILRLIGLDREPSVFLGRPCFNGMASTPPCNYTYWNDARYSEPVVASMTAAMPEATRCSAQKRSP